jgi:hypothetical protein
VAPLTFLVDDAEEYAAEMRETLKNLFAWLPR